MIRVLIAAASMALRVGLRALLQNEADTGILSVTAESASLEAPLPVVDVILAAGELAIRIPSADAERLPGLLLLTRDPDAAQAFLQRWPGQLWGVLEENSSGEELITAILALAQGLTVGSPVLLQSLFSMKASPVEDQVEPGIEALTAREREVLQHLAYGLANKQISIALGISEHTVKFHISAIYAKLGVSSRTEAVRTGFKSGLIAL